MTSRLSLLGYGLLLIALLSNPCLLAVEESTVARKSTIEIVEVSFGIAGEWKVGRPTQTLVTLRAGEESLAGSLQVKTVDADGVEVIYEAECEVPARTEKTLRFVLKHGRLNRPIAIDVYGKDGLHRGGRLVSAAERGQPLPVHQPWIVGLGKELDLEQAALRSARGELPSYSVSEVTDVQALPHQSSAYLGVDLLVLATSNWELLDALTSEQRSAIIEWVHRGGHLMVWAGIHADRLQAGHWLGELMHVADAKVMNQVDPGILESYLSSQKRLSDLACGAFTIEGGLVELSLTAPDRTKFPFLLRRAAGFGQIQLCAADLDVPPLRDWTDRQLLLERLLDDHWLVRDTNQKSMSSETSYLGFQDLAGQARATLDTFQRVQSGSLTLFAAIVGASLLLLVLFDYFVIARRWQRPVWTWGSLGLWSCTALIGISFLTRSWKPAQSILNSMEFVDVEYESQRERGIALAHHYSGDANNYDLTFEHRTPKKANGNIESEAEAQPPEERIASSSILSWSGQPGLGLGGFDSNVRTDLGFAPYRVRPRLGSRPAVPNDLGSQAGTSADEPRSLADGQEGMASAAMEDSMELADVGIPYGGSKAFEMEWLTTIDLSHAPTHFSTTGTSDLLEGMWTNPLAADLHDAFLLYRGWIYRLPSRIRSGAVIRIATQDSPKDLGRYLQRRQIVKDSDLGEPWNPAEHRDLPRLMEMLGLHTAAGGSGYTGLENRYWHRLDFSELLRLQRVIVVGQLKNPVVHWKATKDGNPLDVVDGQRRTTIRFVIPVARTHP